MYNNIIMFAVAVGSVFFTLSASIIYFIWKKVAAPHTTPGSVVQTLVRLIAVCPDHWFELTTLYELISSDFCSTLIFIKYCCGKVCRGRKWKIIQTIDESVTRTTCVQLRFSYKKVVETIERLFKKHCCWC